ncbi:MAG TPA: hypothetical protein VFS56_01490 [Gemmatimonadaceae bacterium]|nr:hypothetical protein [Gemmatimonadaceae bacterium]
MTIPAWLKGTVLLAVALGAGVAIGISYERRRMPSHEASGSHHMVEGLKQRLELDSAQVAAIAVILARRQAVVDSTWHVLQPHVRATMDSTLREIVDVLRPDQATKYSEMVRKRHPQALHQPNGSVR